jgi:hypothetical protein
MAHPESARPAAGPMPAWNEDLIAEARSPCPDFRVVKVQRCGKRLLEAYRVSGEGMLYSVTTTDLDELNAILLQACSLGCGSG